MASAKRSIVMAVDFGTTYSGVAWAQTSNPEAHYVINQWPDGFSGSQEGMTSEKVPSEVAFTYESSTPNMIWGFQIPDSMPRLQWIKLALDPDQKPGLATSVSLKHRDARRMELPHHATEESVVTGYLRALVDYVLKTLKTQVGAALDSMEMTYVITVPAIWSDQAKFRTLTCAEKAGLGNTSKIHIVSEPEAAAIHTLKATNPHNLNVDDTIVLCDAGGGTVDLITFTIVQLSPALRLREAAPGIGGLCGSTFLNRRFEEFIRNRLGSCDEWDNDTMEQTLHRFELVTKRRFAGEASDAFAFPVPGIPDNRDLKVRRGCLHVTGDEMRGIFLPVLQEILDLIEKQIRISKTPVKSVFLVGGFGQNPFLRRYLRESVPSGVEVLTPVDGWTAVVRGALAKALSGISTSAPQVNVVSRVARKNYGMIKSVEFCNSIHDAGRKYWSDFYGHYRIDVMNWFICKGDDIKEDEPIITHWTRRTFKTSRKQKSICVTFYEFDPPEGVAPPLYFTRAMRRHTVLNPTLDPKLRRKIKSVRGIDGEDYWEVDYQIHAHYFSAHCEYSLWFAGKNQGSIEVQYV